MSQSLFKKIIFLKLLFFCLIYEYFYTGINQAESQFQNRIVNINKTIKNQDIALKKNFSTPLIYNRRTIRLKTITNRIIIKSTYFVQKNLKFTNGKIKLII